MKNFVKKLGDVLTVINPLIMLILSYILCSWYGVLYFSIIYLISIGISQILKGIFDSPRPRDTVDDHVIYVRGYSHNDGESFLSQHMVSAFAPVAYALFFINPWWVFLPFFVTGSLCGWTRVYVKAHWILDVVSAGILTLIVGITVRYFTLI